jgi:mRNA deadenylase 3'-5' endonuclease subunit Ccr4
MLAAQLCKMGVRVGFGLKDGVNNGRKEVKVVKKQRELSKWRSTAQTRSRRYCNSLGVGKVGSREIESREEGESEKGAREVEGMPRTAGGGTKFNWRELPESKRSLGTFKVSSYNILADSYSEPGPGRLTILKPFVQGRLSLILKDIDLMASDVVCLQEVEAGLVDSHFRSFFQSRGYDFEYCVNPRANDPLTPEHWKPRVDGLLMAWRTAKFNKISSVNLELRQMIFEHPQKWGVERKTLQNLLRLDTPITIAMLETTHVRTAKKLLCMANYHGFAGGEHSKPLINVIQTQLALHGIRKVMYQHLGMNPKKVEEDAPAPLPLIFAGDFNMRPGSGSYQLMSSGHVPADSSWLTYSPGKQSTTVDMRHHLQLQSAYGYSSFGEPRTTYYASPSLNGTLDYLWYTPGSLQVHRLLDTPDFATRVGVKLPTVEYPSDHLPIGAEFSFSQSFTSPDPQLDPLNNEVTYVKNEYVARDFPEKPRYRPTPKSTTPDLLEDPEIDQPKFKPSSQPKSRGRPRK